jgi:hypothetical protein
MSAASRTAFARDSFCAWAELSFFLSSASSAAAELAWLIFESSCETSARADGSACCCDARSRSTCSSS